MARKIVKVTNQAELDAALEAKGVADVWICSDGRFVVLMTPDDKTVSARETAHVEAWGSSHVEAWGSSHVVAWESSHVVAWGSSSVCAFNNSKITATKYVAVQRREHTVTVIGDGVVIDVPPITTPEQWCEFYGVAVVGGVATLFKGVRDNYKSAHDFLYAPGSTPEAPDWDQTPECGSGLHFCAHPLHTLGFDSAATKFLACPIALTDIVVHHPAQYPTKVKARRICAPIVEVDRYGKPLADAPAAVAV